METNREYLLKESPLKLLLKMGLPAIAMALVDEMNSFIDAIFMGQYFGSDAVSSMSIILPAMLMIISVASLISEGASIAISKYMGANKLDKGNVYVANTIALTLILSTVCGIVFYLLLPAIMDIYNISETVRLYSMIYLQILCLGMPVFMLTMVLGRFVYLEGKTSFLLLSTVLQLIFNIIINYVLIGYLGFGVAGAAIGTLIAELIQIVLLYRYIQSDKMMMHLSVKNVHIEKVFLKEIFFLGLPTFVSTVLLSVTLGIESKIISDFGSAALSVQTITGYAFSISSSIAQGIMGVGLVLMSYAAGAGIEKRYFKLLRLSGVCVLVMVLVLNSALVLNSQLVASIFTNAASVLKLVQVPAMVYGITAPFIFTTNVILYAMQPIGMENLSTVLFTVQQIVLFVPLLLILKNYGFVLAVSAQPISEVVGGLITLAVLPMFIKNAKEYFMKMEGNHETIYS